jgi:glycerol uptake facilitator protein
VFVIFGVIHTKAAPGFAGVAIGLVVFAAIIPVAPATAAAINPARVVGPMVVLQAFGGDVQWDQLPTYVLAEVAAGVAAGLSYALVSRSRPTQSVDITADDGVLAPRAPERVA